MHIGCQIRMLAQGSDTEWLHRHEEQQMSYLSCVIIVWLNLSLLSTSV